MIDTTEALKVIINPASTVQQLEKAADVILGAHPERPRAPLLRLLAAEALGFQHAMLGLRTKLQELEETIVDLRVAAANASALGRAQAKRPVA